MVSAVSGLSPSQIAALSADSVARFTPADIAALTTAQVHALTASQLNALSTTDIRAFRPTQISALTTSALLGLSISQTANFTTRQIASLTSAQTQALTVDQINGLGKADLDSLNVAYLTTAQVRGLNNGSIGNLSPAQVGRLSPTQLGVLSSDQIAALSPAQLNALSPARIAGFSQAQTQALTATQLNGLSRTNLDALNIANLTTAQIQNLSTNSTAKLSGAQVATLLATRATSLSAAQISSFTTAQLASISLVGVSGGLQINLKWDFHTRGAPAGFRNAVVAAAANMAATFSNQAVLNIQVGYGEIDGEPLGAGSAAESASFGNYFSYSAVNGALQRDAGNSTVQSTADARLGAADPTHGGTFFVSTAEQKALGLLSPTSPNLDGYISLSSALPFQFNQTAAAGKYDAVGALEHEISEVMGRTGSVGAAYGAGVYTPLDLFRYTSSNNANPAAGTPVRALTQNNASYFSIDGGHTNLGNYNASTGMNDYADWNASELGDPFGFSIAGANERMTANDAVEMAVLGWNLTSAGMTLASALTAYQTV